MNKKMITVVSAMLAVSLMASTAYAAAGGNNKSKGNSPNQAKANVEITINASPATVTEAVYGEPGKGAKGLLNAYGNVKGKPAGERIAALLLSKYNIEVAADANLSEVVDALDADGQLEAAIEVQEENILENLRDLKQYKKLSKLKEKAGKKGVKAYVNGKEPKFDVPPMIIHGRTLVPFRAIAESLNAEVQWIAETRTVVVTRADIEVKLQLDSRTAWVNGKEVAMDVPGQLNGNRVVVPIRFISEALKAEVEWDEETKSVIVIDETQIETEEDIQENTEENTEENAEEDANENEDSSELE